MKRVYDSKITLLLLAFVALLLTTVSAKADFTFGTPVKVEPVFYDCIDCLSYDGLEMYIYSGRSGGQGGLDLWVLRRASIDDDWGPPENLGPVVNSSQDDEHASISADGLVLYFTSNGHGGYGMNDIYMTTRTTKNDPWGPPVNLGAKVNSSASDGEMWVSTDGLELYFKSDRLGGYGAGDVWVTRRATEKDPWGEPVNIGPVVNSAYEERYPSLSPDGLLQLFSDCYHCASRPPRPGGYGGDDIWMTRRASLSDPWQAPVNLGPKINGPSDDYQPRISPDGRTLYFFSSRTYTPLEAPIIPVVDFNGDGIVNMKDFSMLAQYWRQNEPSVDIGPMPWGDGIVDMRDLSVLAQYWVTELPEMALAHWKLDETEGWVARDSTGTRDGIVMTVHPLWLPTEGKVNGALEFDGADDYVSTLFLLNPAVGPFSIFAWVKGGSPGQVIISQKGGADWLCADPSEGNLMTGLKAADQGQALISHSVITDGQWHKVGLSCDGSNRILYVDYAEVAKDTQAGLTGSQGGLQIGAGKGLEAGSFWTGLIDDVQIYDRVIKP